MNGGIIKFNQIHINKPIPDSTELRELIHFRNKLFNYKLIGETKEGIGYGNISIREKSTMKFIISASGTGKIILTNRNHFSAVDSVNLQKNKVKCTGRYPASSESMTHYMIYKLSNKVNSIIHIHNSKLWNVLMDKMPCTQRNSAYGTPEIAQEIKRLWNESNLKSANTIVMKGHKDGIIVFGTSIEEAFNLVMSYNNNF